MRSLKNSRGRSLGNRFVAIILSVLVTAVVVQSPCAYAASVSSKVKTSKQTKTKKSAKSQQQALSQGFSASEALLMSQSRWNTVLSQSFSRGLDEFNDTYFSSTSLSLSYRLNTWSALALSTGYNTIALKDDGQFFSNEDPDPNRFGLSNTSVSWSVPRIWSSQNKKTFLNYFLSTSLPTSRASQRSTLITSVSNGLTLRHRFQNRLLLSSFLSLRGSLHRKDTADVAGFSINSPVGLSYGAGLAYPILSRLITSLRYSQSQRLDYEDNIDVFQSVSVSANYIAAASLSIFAGYSYSDRIITNDEVFDDDRSSIFMGVSYAY